MVTIPVYQPGQVARRAVASNRRTGPGVEAFGANVGAATQRLGGALGNAAEMADRLAEQQAESAAREAAIAASTRVREELWGENGIMRQDGRKFIDAVEPTKKRLEDFRNSFSGRGRNSLESRMIEDTLRREIEPALMQMDRSYAKAVVDENRATASARTTNLIDGSVQVFGDDAAWKETDAKLRGAIADEADAYGYDPETRKLKERQAYSRAYIYGISASLDADDTATAEKRFEEAVALGRLTGEAAVALKEKIDDAKNTLVAESFGMDVEREQALTFDSGVDFKPPLANPVNPSSTYGPRKHPIDGVVKNHTGIDYPVPEGTPVLASAPGKVVEVKNRGGYGLLVRVDHGGGNETWYTHLSAANVKEGDLVKQGQALAKSGNSGKSTGPHLHYEVRHSGAPVDPTKPPPRVEPTLENLRAVALARSGGDPQLFKKLMAEGSAAIQRREAIKREREEALRDAVWRYAETATAESQIPRSLWNSLKPQDRDAFRSQIKGNLEGGSETDVGHYGALMTMLSDRPKDFAQYAFETDTKLSTADKKAFIKQRTELRAGQMDPGKRSSLEVTNRAANLVVPSSMKPDEQERLKGVLFRAVSDAEAAAGKPLDEKTIMDMAGKLAVDAATNNGKTPLYKAGAGGVKPNVVVWSNIPVGVRNQLIADYQKKFGRMPTAGQVADRYVMMKARGLLP